MGKFATLVEALHNQAAKNAGIYFINNFRNEEYLAYSALLAEAGRFLAACQATGVGKGDEVVLQFKSTRTFVIAYWACLLGGMVPVPLAYADTPINAEKVLKVWKVLRQPWLATDGEELPGKLKDMAEKADLTSAYESISAALFYPGQIDITGREPHFAEPQAEDIAFIQFSSGSTGQPKGIMLKHRNIITNVYDLLTAFGIDERDSFLSWLPLSHDFGMMAMHLAPIVLGVNQHHIPTDTFIWNPTLWFSSVNKYQVSILGSPNFGYRHFLKRFKAKVAQTEEWDLRCVKLIMNGAEPISVSVCREFVDVLGEWGLGREVIRPAYGLAEATLVVSAYNKSEPVISYSVDRNQLSSGQPVKFVEPGAPEAMELVDCGYPVKHTEVRITDEQRRPVGENVVGFIEIRGPNVTAGYYENPQATRQVLTPDGWLNTHDLGFMRNGRLVCVGRAKEMIIIGGTNYFPQDIESIILRGVGKDNANKYIVCGAPNPDKGSDELLVFVYYKKKETGFRPYAEEVKRLVLEGVGLRVDHVLPVPYIPKTTSGKIQRYKLVEAYRNGEFDDIIRKLAAEHGQAQTPPEAPQAIIERKPSPSKPTNAATPQAEFTPHAYVQDSSLLQHLQKEVENILGFSGIDVDTGFFDLGLSSAQLLMLQEKLEKQFALDLTSTAVVDYPSIRTLADMLAKKLPQPEPHEVQADRAQEEYVQEDYVQGEEKQGTYAGEPIAVVGMACRFPGGVKSPADFWQLLIDGVDPVREVPAERWKLDSLASQELATREGGFLDQIDEFDPLFFGISPAEAEHLDPQQRLLLELTWEALEDAGWNPKEMAGSQTGVFIGISGSEYAQVGRDYGHPPGQYTFTGTMLNTAAGRLSYTFGFHGPCMAIDTACSSSLVAVHQGMMQLRAGNCDAAIAGGVNLILRSDIHNSFSKLQALSPSGRCRSYDEGADGYIRSEGGAVLILKRLSDAERDGDAIWGVLRGGAVNHNGHSAGFTVPNGVAQQQVIRAALADAGLRPEDIDYIEGHGSGTKIGDPQEVNALIEVFGKRERTLYLGSVKSNVGHLEAAAGMASLCKVLLAMRHGRIPANLHYRKGNPLIDWEHIPLQIVDKPTDWPLADGSICRAGVSSLGINGTNAHIVVEGKPETPKVKAANMRYDTYVCTMSARTESALRDYVRQMAEWCRRPQATLGELCHRLTDRAALSRRLALTASDMETLAEKLKRLAQAKEPLGTEVCQERQPLVFMFTGQGSLYHQMGRDLYEQAEVFRQKLNELDKLFHPLLGHSIIQLLYGKKRDDFQRPLYAQPMIFAVQVALLELWRSLGIEPDLFIGHSIGEYAAAYADGVISLSDAVKMVAARAKIMDETPENGRMVGILTSEAAVQELLRDYDDVSIAAVNGPENVTVSGGKESMEKLIKSVRQKKIFVEELPVSHPFHSVLMQQGAKQLAKALAGVQFKRPQRWISTLTGDMAAKYGKMDAAYWAQHLVQPVRFSEAVQTALRAGASTFVEIGTTSTLCGLAAQITSDQSMIFLPSLRKNQPAWKQFFASLGRLWEIGYAVRWNRLYAGRSRRIPNLPHTPFDRRKVWFAPAANTVVQTLAAGKVEEVKPGMTESCTLSPVAATAPANARHVHEQVKQELKRLIANITGVAAADISESLNIFTLGIDSLMLVQMRRNILQEYQVEILINSFFTELHTINLLADFIVEHMPGELRPDATNRLGAGEGAEAEAVTDDIRLTRLPAERFRTTAANEVHAIVQQQLSIMEEQLRLLAGRATLVAELEKEQPRKTAVKVKARKNNREISLSRANLTPQQERFLEKFITRWNERTKCSKQYAAKHRQALADWIVSLNFDLTIKELVYPIVSNQAQGSRFTDLDGNEYVDTAMGYGVAFFGHKPDFVVAAVEAQLQNGFALGPQSAVVGEAAELIKKLAGVERVAFCNTGTEAVMVALRLARTVTGRDKIVRFTTSFHGSFDGILADAGSDGSQPMTDGIPQSMVEDTVVLGYGSQESLDVIERMGTELAAVLVEPVQSRNPSLQPKEYLHRLRELCSQHGIALIFDEMITGFRIDIGGAQAYFGVEADIVTYGKLVGGGMPIGIVAGKAKYLDAVDGGQWSYGDDSAPDAPTTFFAGTFCKHPLTMAACLAVLRKLDSEGPALIAQANERTQRFVEQANAYFREAGVPLKAVCFGSMYRFESLVSTNMALLPLELNLFFRLMMEAGVYVWERRTCFFSTAHTDEDVERILQALRYGVETLRDGGFAFRAFDAPPPGGKESNSAQDELSSLERRVYVLSHLKGGNEAYQIRGVLDLSGPLELEQLQAAWAKITRRHEMLRCSYHVQGSQIVRRIAADVEQEYMRADLRNEAEKEAFARFWERPFDLAKPPLWRWALVISSEGRHQLFIAFHHLIADGISMNIILQELEAIFRALPLPEPTLSYWQYADKENAFLRSPEAARQRKWWLEQLKPLPPALHLPKDAPRPEINEFKGADCYFRIGADVVKRVKQVAQDHHATPFMVLLAAWSAFLGEISAQEDFCIGIPIDRRNVDEFNHTVGMFAQTLPVRVKPSAGLRFDQFLAAVREMCLGAYEHADYPLDALLEDLPVTRDLSRNPLFDVMFDYEKDDQRVIDLHGVRAELGEVYTRSAQFDLTLEMLERRGELHCKLNYAVPHFSQARIADWINRFQHYLQKIVHDPAVKLGEIELIGEKEKQELLALGCGPVFNIRQPLLSEVCTKVFANYEERPAIWFNGGEISYKQLSERVQKMAGRLRAEGLGHGDKVGLLLYRTPGLLTAMLAAMHIGCVWVPLDPAFPRQRLKYMIEKSGIKRLVSQPDIMADCRLDLPYVDEADIDSVLAIQNGKEGEANGETRIAPDDLAYIMFTSGSTGRPKGVQLSHGALANFVTSMAQALDWPDEARTAWITTPAFDIFLLETLLCLYHGGCVVIVGEEQAANPGTLRQVVREGNVNCLQMTPTRLQLFCAGHEAAADVLKTLHRLIIGGERFPNHLLPALQQYEDLRIFNVYGPTETCIWSTCKELTKAEKVTIGRPIGNTRVYVLDAQRRLLPEGEVGEMWIGGAGVAQGYLLDPSLTAECFVADPFSGGRMYRTGDLVRWKDGELEFLGRADNQVKIQGYRIELGEIEEVLREHPALANAAAALKELSPGNHVLVAYYQPGREQKVNAAELQEWLRQRLPAYMVPAFLLEIAALPQTPNGKIDRKALPLPTVSSPSEAQTIARGDLAAEELEQLLLNIWKKVLGERPIGLHDSFFDVGGTSFKLILLHAELEQLFPGVITVADLFALPTISKLARFIAETGERSSKLLKGWLPLPEDWFGEVSQEGRIETTLEAASEHTLRKAGELYGLTLEETLSVLLALYLHKTLNENPVPLWMVKNTERAALVNMNFSDEADLENVLQDFASALPPLKDYENTSLMTPPKVVGVVRVACVTGAEVDDRRLLRKFDLIFAMHKQHGEVRLSFVHSKLLSASQLVEHMNRWSKMLKLIAEQLDETLGVRGN